MSAKHTPGPWVIDREVGPRQSLSVFPENGRRIAVVEIYQNPKTGKRLSKCEADAALIAAAPELLAACKAALGAFEENWVIDWNDLTRAIAKAEGRKS